MPVVQQLGVPRDADFYLCGPTAFMSELTVDLAAWGVATHRIHTEIFGSGPSRTPGVAAAAGRPPHLPDGPASTGPLVSFARSNLSVHWGSAFNSLLELAEACDVPVRWGAGPASATAARRDSSSALSAIGPTRSGHRPMAMC